jgi:preprotein translocase subunit SecE
MASKTAIANSEERSTAITNFTGGAGENWGRLTRFLSDVRAEMKKVVWPSRKEVESTTTVVIIAVFIFGLFFFLTDFVFNQTIHQILTRLGGAQ